LASLANNDPLSAPVTVEVMGMKRGNEGVGVRAWSPWGPRESKVDGSSSLPKQLTYSMFWASPSPHGRQHKNIAFIYIVTMMVGQETHARVVYYEGIRPSITHSLPPKGRLKERGWNWYKYRMLDMTRLSVAVAW
jgi:hypothetical protein